MKMENSTRRHTLPVLPLRGMVVFPGVTVPIGAGRPATLKAIEAALETQDRMVLAVSQRTDTEDPKSDDLFAMGTVARIGHVQRGLGGMQLLLQGEKRGVVLRYSETDNYMEAVVQEVPDLDPVDADDALFAALYREVRERGAELGERTGIPEDVIKQVLDGVDDPGRFADLVAGYIDVPSEDRQDLLETLGVEERLRRVLVHVQRQIGLLKAQAEIKSQVQEELGERQREMFLREQLKTIRRELGDEDEAAGVDELAERLAKLNLPAVVQKEIDKELSRLNRASSESMEALVIRTYLETVVELPWNQRTTEGLDLSHAQGVLDEDHYGLDDVKDRVLEYLAVRQLQQGKSDDSEPSGNEDDRSPKGTILMFAGPPGTGKTSIAKSIARAMGRKYVRVALGGARDEADIRGHRRTYVGAMPGRIIEGLKRAGTKNPVFLLDEVDKLGVSFQGNPAAALLEVLDPAQNDSFTDHYLGVPFDLSEVMFIATANFLGDIPAPLLDRMEIVEFSGYTEDEKLAIARKYLVPRRICESGLEPEQLDITDDAISTTISSYTREAGVRQLERELGKVARKVARKIAGDEVEKFAVDLDNVDDLLGRPTVHPEHAATEDHVGTATGLYYTPAGGDIMFVEVSVMSGQDNLLLTGQLGDVMKESARAALSYAKTHAAELGIAQEVFGGKDIHIHVPAGAVPKDGPSAGVTMATALTSALSGIPVRHDVAMTGEVTLSGRVLPIGGVREKVLGAVRAGITEVILPKENMADLEDLTEDQRDRIKVWPVETLMDVLAVALKGGLVKPDPILRPSQDVSLVAHPN